MKRMLGILMYISKKHFSISNDGSYIEYPPKVYVDWFSWKPNLKKTWRDNAGFNFSVGFFKFHLIICFYWNFVERERSEREEDTYQRTLEFLRGGE